jgi:hypothetical protein
MCQVDQMLPDRKSLAVELALNEPLALEKHADAMHRRLGKAEPRAHFRYRYRRIGFDDRIENREGLVDGRAFRAALARRGWLGLGALWRFHG